MKTAFAQAIPVQWTVVALRRRGPAQPNVHLHERGDPGLTRM